MFFSVELASELSRIEDNGTRSLQWDEWLIGCLACLHCVLPNATTNPVSWNGAHKKLTLLLLVDLFVWITRTKRFWLLKDSSQIAPTNNLRTKFFSLRLTTSKIFEIRLKYSDGTRKKNLAQFTIVTKSCEKYCICRFYFRFRLTVS